MSNFLMDSGTNDFLRRNSWKTKEMAFSFTHLKIHAVSGDWEVSVPADGHDLEQDFVHVCQ